MGVTQASKVSENTHKISTTVRLPSQAADNSYRTVLCMLLSLFILSAVLTVIGILMSTWKRDSITEHEIIEVIRDKRESKLLYVC